MYVCLSVWVCVYHALVVGFRLRLLTTLQRRQRGGRGSRGEHTDCNWDWAIAAYSFSPSSSSASASPSAAAAGEKISDQKFARKLNEFPASSCLGLGLGLGLGLYCFLLLAASLFSLGFLLFLLLLHVECSWACVCAGACCKRSHHDSHLCSACLSLSPSPCHSSISQFVVFIVRLYESALHLQRRPQKYS